MYLSLYPQQVDSLSTKNKLTLKIIKEYFILLLFYLLFFVVLYVNKEPLWVEKKRWEIPEDGVGQCWNRQDITEEQEIR